ncbi:Cd(II)/Pb(II)-responsive transcriptional regulator [Geopsychrobacter electrodiphilus]|uniref:Cd(II)/Pb(II)-responsive transcriptional regulator n=1 Tax=Geopsychrobacter electrodiphilus TaxID=225196 RepID=UPI00036BB7C5|nr:Cd(II)/Pb(II)-responsive transcriptional regulator [Geopsychrobacter electrodiphilus]
MKMTLKIGELASRTRCPVETIRFYEKEGILPPPPRSSGNYRLYGEKHVECLLFVRRCRSLDMTLEEIRRLLLFRDAPQEDCTAVSAFLDEHIGQISTRITELEHLKDQLEALRQLCSGARTAEQCGILQELGSSGFTIEG